MKRLKFLNEYKLDIGSNIRKWRDLNGLKQADLSKLINVSTTTLSNFENGISKPNTNHLEDIATALEINIFQLISGLDPIFNSDNYVNSSVSENSNSNLMDNEILKTLLNQLEKKDNDLKSFIKEMLTQISRIINPKDKSE
jgi:transcriptional regulator with XRE-family HTH domain